MINYSEPTPIKLSEETAIFHELYDYVGDAIIDHYASEADKLKHYEHPLYNVETKEFITHREDVLAALKNGASEIQVILVTGADRNKLFRLVMKGLHFKGYMQEERYNLIVLLENHLQNVDKDWMIELSKQGYKDINDKLAAILNCSKDLIKLMKRKGQESTPVSKPTVDLQMVDISQIRFGDHTIDFNIVKHRKYQRDGKVIIEFKTEDLLNLEIVG